MLPGDEEGEVAMGPGHLWGLQDPGEGQPWGIKAGGNTGDGTARAHLLAGVQRQLSIALDTAVRALGDTGCNGSMRSAAAMDTQ